MADGHPAVPAGKFACRLIALDADALDPVLFNGNKASARHGQ